MSEKELFEIRPAKPTIPEGLLFAKLLEEAQEGVYRIMIGRTALDIIARAYIRPGHELSYLFAEFAEMDGQVVGLGAGYTATDHLAFTEEPLVAAAGWRRHRIAFFSRLNQRALSLMDTHSQGDFYVRALAVDPELRGRGVGTGLMESLEVRAKGTGSSRITLDVAAKNQRGRRLYERLGFVVEAASPRWFGMPNTNILRMVKSLGDG